MSMGYEMQFVYWVDLVQDDNKSNYLDIFMLKIKWTIININTLYHHQHQQNINNQYHYHAASNSKYIHKLKYVIHYNIFKSMWYGR